MALSDNPFALLNPGPLPARIPNSFGPPPGTIMPNQYDRIKAMLDAQQAASQQYHNQTINQPFTAEQLMTLFPGPTPAQQAQTQQDRIANILAEQQAGAAMHGQTLNQPFTAAQLMTQFPATVNPTPPSLIPSPPVGSASPSSGSTLVSQPSSALTLSGTRQPYALDRPHTPGSLPQSTRTPGFVIPTQKGRTASSLTGWGRGSLGSK